MVNVVEPQNAEFVLEYAVSLQELNREKAEFNTPHGAFKQQSWLWILEHLFVDRGTVFNSKEFMKFTIAKFARHYSMDYEDLLLVITEGVSNLKKTTSVKPAFFTALDLLISEERVVDGKNPAIGHRIQDERFDVFESLLSNQQIHQNEYKLNDLFSALATTDSKKLRRILLSGNNRQVAITEILECFKAVELKKLVEVVMPIHHEVVNAFIASTHVKLKEAPAFTYNQKLAQKLIWKVVLNYLFEDRGSTFNKRSFLKQTILSISVEVGMSYVSILSILTYLTHSTQNYLKEQELGYLLHELVKEADLNQDHSNQVAKNKEQLLEHYLDVSNSRSIETRWDIRQIIADRGQNNPSDILRLLDGSTNKRETIRRVLAKF